MILRIKCLTATLLCFLVAGLSLLLYCASLFIAVVRVVVAVHATSRRRRCRQREENFGKRCKNSTRGRVVESEEKSEQKRGQSTLYNRGEREGGRECIAVICESRDGPCSRFPPWLFHSVLLALPLDAWRGC